MGYKITGAVSAAARSRCVAIPLSPLLRDWHNSQHAGVFQTAMAVFEHATLQEIVDAAHFGALSPVRVPPQPTRWPIRDDEDLGILSSYINESADQAIVMRSWGLFEGGEYYGSDFTWREYMRVANWITAFFWMFVAFVALLLPVLGPMR